MGLTADFVMPVRKRRRTEENLSPDIVEMGRGYTYSAREKYLIMEVLTMCKSEAELTSLRPQYPITRTADYCNTSISNVKRIQREYELKGEFVDPARGNYRKKECIEDAIADYIPVLRRFVYQRQANQQATTVNDCLAHIKEAFSDFEGVNKVHRTTVWRSMILNNIVFGKVKNKKLQIEENPHLMMKREDFLIKIHENRRKGPRTRRPEIYLDESYIWEHHRRKNSFILADQEVNTGRIKTKGKRVICIYAIGEKGPIRDTLLTYVCQRSNGGRLCQDYHGNVNTDVYMGWCERQLFPNIPKKSLIILDNAPYHRTKPKDLLPKDKKEMTRDEIVAWLTERGVTGWSEENSKPVLLKFLSDVVEKHKSIFEIEAEKRGFEVLWTPPYHPDYNPIENIWGISKDAVAKQYSVDTTMDVTKQRWELELDQNLDDDLVIRTVERAQRIQTEDYENMLEEMRNDKPYNPADDSDGGEILSPLSEEYETKSSSSEESSIDEDP